MEKTLQALHQKKPIFDFLSPPQLVVYSKLSTTHQQQALREIPRRKEREKQKALHKIISEFPMKEPDEAKRAWKISGIILTTFKKDKHLSLLSILDYVELINQYIPSAKRRLMYIPQLFLFEILHKKEPSLSLPDMIRVLQDSTGFSREMIEKSQFDLYKHWYYVHRSLLTVPERRQFQHRRSSGFWEKT